jgi:hypothetical protein
MTTEEFNNNARNFDFSVERIDKHNATEMQCI